MKIFTARQQSVLRYIERAETPCTVREVAEAYHAPESSVRAAMRTLERHGCIERRGVALSGGATWGSIQRVVS